MSTPGSIPGLERIQVLLEEMGNPQKELQCIHIAGTNGKGTTSLIIGDILCKAAYKTGRYTSPHIHSYLERFSIDGIEIEDKVFIEYLNNIESIVALMHEKGYTTPTEFEILTAMAFQYFRDEKVDVAVLEVGLGGLYDATNVVIPLVSVITGIDFDHTDYLGNTLEEIAFNKAGIIKKGIPVIVGEMQNEALEVIRRKAEAEKAQLVLSSEIVVQRHSMSLSSGQILNINGKSFEITEAQFSLLGDFQLKNLATALSVIDILKKQGFSINEEEIIEVLKNLCMPGRLEVLSENPLVIADVAHNLQAAKALNSSLDKILPGRKRILVCGLLDDKDIPATLGYLGKNTSACIITKPEGPRSEHWQKVGQIWERNFPGIIKHEEENIITAVKKGLEIRESNEYVLISGSFYILNKARGYFTNT